MELGSPTDPFVHFPTNEDLEQPGPEDAEDLRRLRETLGSTRAEAADRGLNCSPWVTNIHSPTPPHCVTHRPPQRRGQVRVGGGFVSQP